MTFLEQFPNVRSGKFGSIICLIQSETAEFEVIFTLNLIPLHSTLRVNWRKNC